VEKGAALNVPGDYGFTSLHFAAHSSGAALVQWLLDQGAKVVRDEGGGTPLHRSINSHAKDTTMWEFFLANGCSVKDVDDDLQTLLHASVARHNLTAAKWSGEERIRSLRARRRLPTAQPGAGRR
jgi:ankyrin repeat protein